MKRCVSVNYWDCSNCNIMSISLDGSFSSRAIIRILAEQVRKRKSMNLKNVILDCREAKVRADSTEKQHFKVLYRPFQRIENASFRVSFICNDEASLNICRTLAFDLVRAQVGAVAFRSIDEALIWALETERLFNDIRHSPQMH